MIVQNRSDFYAISFIFSEFFQFFLFLTMEKKRWKI